VAQQQQGVLGVPETAVTDDADSSQTAYWKKKAAQSEHSAELLYGALNIAASNMVELRGAFDGSQDDGNASLSGVSGTGMPSGTGMQSTNKGIPMHDDVVL